MSSSTMTQALVAAFAFGVVLNSASGAVVAFTKSYRSKSCRGGPRLVLTFFLSSAALWSLFAFTALALDEKAVSGCRTISHFVSAFDQLARLSFIQFLLWSIQDGAKATSQTLVLQGAIILRFLAGGVVTGFQRPQQGLQICVATNGLMPLGIAVACLDLAMALLFSFKVFTQGSFKVASEGSTPVARRKSLLLCIGGFSFWTGLSVPLLMGVGSWALFTRTGLPALGLAVLLAILVLSKEPLTFDLRHGNLAEGNIPAARDPAHTRQLASQDSGYAPSQYAPPGRYDEVKGPQHVVSISAFAKENGHWPVQNRARPSQVGYSRAGNLPPVNEEPADPPSKSHVSAASRKAPRKLGKVKISAPVLQSTPDDQSNNPFGKIATVDLKTAARNEEIRRVMVNQHPLTSNLVASRPAPRPPVSPETMMKTGASLKRKKIAPTPSPNAASEPLLDPATMVTTTSSELSPGIEELRRRSPRTATQQPHPSHPSPSLNVPKDKRGQHTLSVLSINELTKSGSSSTAALTPPPKSPLRALAPASPFGGTTAYTASTHAPPMPTTEASVKVMIKGPPRRQSLKARSPVDDAAASKSVSGLPRNPKMSGIKPLSISKKQKSQTVMLVQGIEYNDPAAVDSILQDAQAAARTSVELRPSLDHNGSVVHRPRPIPRQSAVDRQIWPAEGSPSPGRGHAHKRSLSTGSVKSRKSILQSQPTSPSQLPPLPPVPQTVATPGRPQPNNTSSMTFDEKMHIFYATVSENVSRPSTSGSESTKSLRRRSTSVPELPELPEAFRARQRSQSRDPLRDSTYQSSRSSIRTSLLNFPEVPETRASSMKDTKRSSSPVLPSTEVSVSRMSASTNSFGNNEDDTTVWGSTYSPVHHTKARQGNAVAIPPVPKITSCPALEEKVRLEEEKVSIKEKALKDETASQGQPRGGEHVMMTVMLDTDSRQDSPALAQQHEIQRVMSRGPTPFPTWHRKIGDELPTFSSRRDSMTRRNKPPPAPLALRKTLDQRPKPKPASEPSPLESPRNILQTIQEQLRKFEDPDRSSTGSQEAQRMTLLQNLELEMGEYEGEWEKMQARLNARDSYSTATGSRRDSLAVSVVEHATHDPVISNRNRRGSQPGVCLRENEKTASVASRRSTESSEKDTWDQELADAQAEYLKHRFQLVGSLSQRATEKALPALPVGDAQNASSLAAAPKSLWQASGATLEGSQTAMPALWSAASRPESLATQLHLPETMRSACRAPADPLVISSTTLWRKVAHRTSFHEPRGLWNDRRPKSTTTVDTALDRKPSRPLTQRPARRSKRITALPDILEDPEPMPNKRGTLALYQFPWGEKSDLADVRPKPQAFMLMPGTMSSGRSSAVDSQEQLRIHMDPVEFDPDDYAESFFDDFDDFDGDEGPGFYSDGEQEEETAYVQGVEYVEQDEESDEFDESTLWEIASLLKSRDVPSRQSLLPEEWEMLSGVSPPSEYSEEDQAEVGYEASEMHAASVPANEQLELWAKVRPEDIKQRGTLPSPDCQTWEAYVASTSVTSRIPARIGGEVEKLQSTDLWTAPSQPTWPASSLWSTRQATFRPAALWIAQPPASEEAKGLPAPSEAVWAAYQADSTVLRAGSRPQHEPSNIESFHLWKPSGTPITRSSPKGMWHKAATQGSLLWTPSAAPQCKMMGVPQPSEQVWSAYQTAGAVARALTRHAGPDTIESFHLWKPSGTPITRSSSKGMWHKAATQDSLLWAPPAAPQFEMMGVPQPSEQVWSAYQTAGAVARALTRHAEPETIESSTLWTAPAQGANSEKGGLWSRATAALSTDMWSPSVESKPTTVGIAQPDADSWAKYTTLPSSSTRVTRTDQSASSPISSSTLWGNTSQSPNGADWMTLSTVRARSPSNASVATTASISTLASEASSVKTTVTKASTVGSFFGSFWKKSRSRGVSDASTAATSVKGSRELSVEDIPEVPAVPADLAPQVPLLTSQEPVRASTGNVPSRRTYRKTIAVQANWDAALQEALEASFPSSRLRRINATSQDWDFALQKAISLSFPSTSTIPTLDIAPTTALWTAAPLRSPFPALPQLWSSRHADKHRATFPDAPVLPLQARRTRAGSESQENEEHGMMLGAGGQKEALTEQTLWRRSAVVEEKERECRTRDWLSRGM